MSITAAIICAVVYAVINWLDPYTLSWQCLNRPIVVAPLVGLLLGDYILTGDDINPDFFQR